MSAHYTWKPVALHLCLLLQQQGFTLDSADNGEEEINSSDIDALVDNLTACDEARLYVSRPFENGGTKKLALYLVFDNEPHETVADYTVDHKLEDALELFEDFWSRRRTPLAEAEASWLEEVRGLFNPRQNDLAEAVRELLKHKPREDWEGFTIAERLAWELAEDALKEGGAQ